MVRFIPAGELKERFDVFGHFYSVQVAPTKTVECRSVLEIIEPPLAPRAASLISELRPDAVFIMMNPGSSRPLTPVDNRIDARRMHRLPISLVPTHPDTTQYQVMRLMHYCGWRHVRVLNLSDLRCAQSNTFFQQFKALESAQQFDAHSIFSARRAEELSRKLVGRIPIVCAWGVSPHLDPLIARCLATLSRVKSTATSRLGLLKAGTTDKFLHPLPSLQSQKADWVNRMVQQCGKSR
ncbi:MAG: DUF1643 domain-containing protein [Pirellulales bacterium]